MSSVLKKFLIPLNIIDSRNRFIFLGHCALPDNMDIVQKQGV
ncbi:hypothetical protein TPE_1472 [Treponema pedis str. T A4]|uniref:Uncharacterized protein n=1 Tax=Treponema pedis str. T A4 TaxID=1291379 RepID=S5ZMZ7_9SPIR|nr:hypothetical protein TPE_1472 [Treponema pedis str. T A4]